MSKRAAKMLGLGLIIYLLGASGCRPVVVPKPVVPPPAAQPKLQANAKGQSRITINVADRRSTQNAQPDKSSKARIRQKTATRTTRTTLHPSTYPPQIAPRPAQDNSGAPFIVWRHQFSTSGAWKAPHSRHFWKRLAIRLMASNMNIVIQSGADGGRLVASKRACSVAAALGIIPANRISEVRAAVYTGPNLSRRFVLIALVPRGQHLRGPIYRNGQAVASYTMSGAVCGVMTMPRPRMARKPTSRCKKPRSKKVIWTRPKGNTNR